jgi:hypothetical protein
MEKILNWKLIIHILEKIDEDLLIGICRTIENDVGNGKNTKLETYHTHIGENR